MGGAGKTTLLRHLGVWWRTTGLVKQVFSFGYDEQAWTRQQIMVAIAQQLLGMATYSRDFQPLSLDAQQAMLTQLLRSEGQNHLLILDNLESITGTHLAIGHTLPPEEQSGLHSFLTDLVGGRTLVLLGSRSLARLWQTSGDANLPATIGSALDRPPAEVETLLRQLLGNEAEGEQTG
jgi:hypothetical protein